MYSWRVSFYVFCTFYTKQKQQSPETFFEHYPETKTENWEIGFHWKNYFGSYYHLIMNNIAIFEHHSVIILKILNE